MEMIKTRYAISDIISNASVFNNFLNAIKRMMQEDIQGTMSDTVDSAMMDALSSQVSYSISRFAIGGYHFLPIYTDAEVNLDTYAQTISRRLFYHLGKYSFLLGEISSENKTKFADLLARSKTQTDNTDTYDTQDSRTEEISRNESHGGADNTTVETNNFAVSETSPITADLETINTPSSKGKSKDVKTESKEFGETVTHTDNITDNSSKTGTIDRVTSSSVDNPELFTMYIEVLQKYNIVNIISSCVKRVISEFNTSI